MFRNATSYDIEALLQEPAETILRHFPSKLNSLMIPMLCTKAKKQLKEGIVMSIIRDGGCDVVRPRKCLNFFDAAANGLRFATIVDRHSQIFCLKP